MDDDRIHRRVFNGFIDTENRQRKMKWTSTQLHSTYIPKEKLEHYL